MNPVAFDSVGSSSNVLPILAAGLALAYLAGSIMTITEPGTKPEVITPKGGIAPNPELQMAQDFSLAGNFHLFGQPDAALPSSGKVPPETTQALKLKGVLYLPGRQAHAIIEASGQAQKFYRINDSLPDGAILQAIENNSIVISRNNRRESLILTKTKLEHESQPAIEQQQEQPQSADEIVIQPPESLAN